MNKKTQIIFHKNILLDNFIATLKIHGHTIKAKLVLHVQVICWKIHKIKEFKR